MNNYNLNIVFIGSSLVSAYWNGTATYYRGIIKSLHERGHKITFYEPDAFQRQEHKDIPDPDGATGIQARAGLCGIVAGTLENFDPVKARKIGEAAKKKIKARIHTATGQNK